jgi:hypothetical protein
LDWDVVVAVAAPASDLRKNADPSALSVLAHT